MTARSSGAILHSAAARRLLHGVDGPHPSPLPNRLHHVLWMLPAEAEEVVIRGRTTGRPRTTPVTVVVEGGQRWLVAPYGPVGWVRNARAAGQVTLTRGRRAETVGLEEVTNPVEAAPILKLYVSRVPITRPYFTAAPDAAVDAFASEAGNHPVFHLIEQTTAT